MLRGHTLPQVSPDALPLSSEAQPLKGDLLIEPRHLPGNLRRHSSGNILRSVELEDLASLRRARMKIEAV